MPWPIKAVIWLCGLVVGAWSLAQAFEYFYDKYKNYGPGAHRAAHQWWLESPWVSTAAVALLCGVSIALISGLTFYAWAKAAPSSTPTPPPGGPSPAADSPPAATAEAPAAIFRQHRVAALPVTVPPGSSLYVMLVSRAFKSAEQASGFYRVSNEGNDAIEWPDQARMKAITALTFGSLWTFGGAARCVISNHGPTGTLQLVVTIRFSGAADLTAALPPLGPGQDFTFYIVNDTTDTVPAFWGSTANLQLVGGSLRSVPLHAMEKNPADSVIMLFGCPLKNAKL